MRGSEASSGEEGPFKEQNEGEGSGAGQGFSLSAQLQEVGHWGQDSKLMRFPFPQGGGGGGIAPLPSQVCQGGAEREVWATLAHPS